MRVSTASLSTSTTGLLSQAFASAEALLKGFVRSNDFGLQMRVAFGELFEEGQLGLLQGEWLAGEWGNFAVEVRSAAELNGARGAFALATNTVYLSQSLLDVGDADAVAAVFLEEFGHFVDGQLNGVLDSPGDEGDIFSRLVRGDEISGAQLESLRKESDQGVIMLDGQFVGVERMDQIQYGDNIFGAIDTPSDLDQYTFEAQAGDRISLRLSDSSIFLDSSFSILDPNNQELTRVTGGSASAISENLEITEAGTYTVSIFDNGADNTGDYNFTLESINNPGDVTSISYGDSASEDINPTSDIDIYTFEAQANDIIDFRLSDSSIFLGASFKIYGPTSDDIPVVRGGSGSAILEDQILTESGTYTVSIFDTGADNTGDYNFTLESINNPGDVTPLVYGESLSGSIDVTSDIDAYTFDAQAGDIIDFRLSDSSIFLGASFKIYDPDNNRIETVIGGSGSAILENKELTQAGMYTVFIFDNGADGTGSYNFTLNGRSGSITNRPPVIVNPIPDQSIDEDSLWSFEIPDDTFSDPDNDPLSIENISGLPPWLNFDPGTTTFSGTPTNGDVSQLSIQVTANDGRGGTVSDVFELTINNTNDAPTLITPIPDQQTQVNEAFTFSLPDNTFEDIDLVVDPNETLTYSATKADGLALPDWLGFDSETQTFSITSGTADIGTFNITVSVTDAAGEIAEDSFELKIDPLMDQTICGTDDDDTLSGTPNRDFIFGKGGNDIIFGNWNDDTLNGGIGDDRLFGNWGNDILQGEDGSDELYGGFGDDMLLGGRNEDILVGSWGDDLLDGGSGNDQLEGGAGSDDFVLRVGDGADTILDFDGTTDRFRLVDGLTLGQLSFSETGTDTLVSLTATNELLATLSGVTNQSAATLNFSVAA